MEEKHTMNRFARIAALLAATSLLAVGAIACGSDDNNDDNTPTTAAKTVAPTQKSGTPAASTTAAAGTLTVTAANIAYSPTDLTGKVGETTTIMLKNSDTVQHTLTVYEDEQFSKPVEGADTGRVAPGATGQFTITFDKAGDLYFRCEIHPAQMMGEISVSS